MKVKFWRRRAAARFSLGEEFQRDLFAVAIRIDRKLYGKKAPKIRRVDSVAETLFNLIGYALGVLLIRLPGPGIANRSTAGFALLKSRHKPAPLPEESLQNLARAWQLKDHALEKLGRRPAVLILMSHPETTGDESRLLGDLVYHATQIARDLTPDEKLVLLQAVDSFALDSLPLPARAAYAGLIRAGHLAVNRLPGKMTPPQKLLFGDFGYDRAIFHFLDRLKRGAPVCAALSGAVPHNTRILYTVKEFSQRVYRLAQKRPFTRRDFTRALIDALTRGEICACTTGMLSERERLELMALVDELGIEGGRFAPALAEFETELKLETPYRLRFFRVLFGRTCARGVPLLILPLCHTRAGTVALEPPTLVSGQEGGQLLYAQMEGTRYEVRDYREDAESFAKNLVRSRLNVTDER